MSIAPLTLIMGVERSGTTALLRSLAQDPRLSTFSEGEGPLYDERGYLRPETESRRFLAESRGPILTKPLNETTIRGVQDLLEEFAPYDPRLIWIYRDPVNVYQSWIVKQWTTELFLPFFLHQWNGRNRRLLSALATHGARITLVRYEDLILDVEIWPRLCDRVGIEGDSVLRPDSRAGRGLVSGPIQDVIDAETVEVWDALEKARTFRPRISRRIMFRYGRTLMGDERRRRALGRGAPTMDSEANASVKGATHPLPPDRLAGLALWLDAGELPTLPEGSAVAEWPARHGSRAVCGARKKGGAFRPASAAQRRPSVFFPPGPADDPDGAQGGFVCGTENEWRFLHDGSPWTVVVVYRTVGWCGSFGAQAVLQAGDGNGAEFGLGVTVWGADVAAISSARRAAEGEPAVVPIVMAAPLRVPGRPEDWRIVTKVHHRLASGGPAISSYLGHRPQSVVEADPKCEYPRSAVSSVLHIAYTPGPNAGPFSGDIAELLIFNVALDDTSRAGVVAYLAEKHGLA